MCERRLAVVDFKLFFESTGISWWKLLPTPWSTTETPSCLRKKDKRDERPGPYEPNQSQSRGCREGAASNCWASWEINQANPSTYTSVLTYTYIERVGELILDATIIYLFCCSIPHQHPATCQRVNRSRNSPLASHLAAELVLLSISIVLVGSSG